MAFRRKKKDAPTAPVVEKTTKPRAKKVEKPAEAVVEQVAHTNTGEEAFVPNVQGYSYGSAPDDDSFVPKKNTYPEDN